MGNIRTNEYGLHAVHEGRSYRRAGGGEEEESARPINVSKVSLSLKAIWRLAVHCAIAKRKRSVAKNATGAELRPVHLPRQAAMACQVAMIRAKPRASPVVVPSIRFIT